MDDAEKGHQLAELLKVSDARLIISPLLFMLEEIEQKLLWNRKVTPPPSVVAEYLVFLDILEGAIIEWFRTGSWHTDEPFFRRSGGPRLHMIDKSDPDLIGKMFPGWLVQQLTERYHNENIHDK